MTSHESLLTSHTSKIRGLLLLFLTIVLLPIAGIIAAEEKEETASYFGDWTNAHGDTLQIKSDSIQVNDEKPVRYDDITEDSDGSFFVLQIKDGNGPSYFEGKFLRITFSKDPDRFTMSIYKTLADALKKQNEVKRVEWSAPAEDDEEQEADGDDAEE